MKRTILLSLLVLLSLVASGCHESTTEGQVKVQVVRGQIKKIIRPSDGWVGTMTTIGDEYFDVDLKSFTEKVIVNGSTKDNAGVSLEVGVTAHLMTDDNSISAHIRKFGLDASERKQRLVQLLQGQINTEVKNAVAQQEAYSLLANQETIQRHMVASLTPIMKSQMHLEIESVQIIGRPNFVDDRIETAASSVVANQKAKEAAEADLARAKVEAEKKQVEAQTYAIPALLELEKLRLRLEIEKARADGIKGHNGPLTIVNGADTQLQLRGTP